MLISKNKNNIRMKVKLFILISILIVILGFVIFFFGFRMLNRKHKPALETENKKVQVQPPPIRKGKQFSPYYTAAIAEIEALSEGDDENELYMNQMVDIIHSDDVREADIVVLPEAFLNRAMGEFYAPNNSTVPCDDPSVHFVFQNISCAARKSKKYVVINAYTRMKCTDDDQDFCVHRRTNSNIYNMMFVFDRKGTLIARYRKYNPYGEGVQITKEVEIVTFRTDFNVTFGIMVCFDIMLHEPGNIFIQRGIRNFVFSTMWHNNLPYGVSVQYQQSWAYANNANLIAADGNWQIVNTTGSGIYAGRAGAQKVFFSEIPMSKVMVARLPINLPSEDEAELYVKPDEEIQVFPQNDDRVIDDERYRPLYDPRMIQDKMELIKVEFLDFTTSNNFTGTVCEGDFCCNYDIEISKNTSSNVNNLPSYSYGISLFNDLYQFDAPKFMRTKQIICCVIACAELDDKFSCGKRFTGPVHYPYSIDKINLNGVLQMDRESNILPSTLTYDVYPLNVGAFEFKKSKLQHEERYMASMKLKQPRSDLLTFGFIGRDYKKDKSALEEMILVQRAEAMAEAEMFAQQLREAQSQNEESHSNNGESHSGNDETHSNNNGTQFTYNATHVNTNFLSSLLRHIG